MIYYKTQIVRTEMSADQGPTQPANMPITTRDRPHGS